MRSFAPIVAAIAPLGALQPIPPAPIERDPPLTEVEILLLQKLARQHPGSLHLRKADEEIAWSLYVPRALVWNHVMVGWCGDLAWGISDRGLDVLADVEKASAA